MIASVGGSAIQIGQTLENLSGELDRLQAATRLVSTYLALREKDKTALQDLERSQMGIEGARFVKNLLQVCRDVELADSLETREVVEKFSERIETEVLADFDENYREGDIAAMASCADILFELNGGASVTRAFVNQHDFFIRRENIESEEVVGDDEMYPYPTFPASTES